jgi:hypothetical protein
MDDTGLNLKFINYLRKHNADASKFGRGGKKMTLGFSSKT